MHCSRLLSYTDEDSLNLFAILQFPLSNCECKLQHYNAGRPSLVQYFINETKCVSLGISDCLTSINMNAAFQMNKSCEINDVTEMKN